MNWQPVAELEQEAAEFEGTLVLGGATDSVIDATTPWEWVRLFDYLKTELEHDTARVPEFFNKHIDQLEAWLCLRQDAASAAENWLPENGIPKADLFEDFLTEQLVDGAVMPGMRAGLEFALAWGEEVVVVEDNPACHPGFFYLLKCMKAFYDDKRALGWDVTG
jgi:hypothetical protein